MLSSRTFAAPARIRKGAPRRLARSSRQARRGRTGALQRVHVCWLAWELGDDRSWLAEVLVRVCLRKGLLSRSAFFVETNRTSPIAADRSAMIGFNGRT